MYNLNANPTMEERARQLTDEAAINLAALFARIEIFTEGGRKKIDDFEGSFRDIMVSIIYTTSETLQILAKLGARNTINSIKLNAMDAAEWYDEAAKTLQDSFEGDEDISQYAEAFTALCERIIPSRAKPDAVAQDEFDEEEFEDGLAEAAGAKNVAH